LWAYGKVATGERRVDSPVSRAVVKNFMREKFFVRFLKVGFKIRFRQFPALWLSRAQ